MNSTDQHLNLPELPKLDPKDLRIVHATIYGKLLGRTAALLSLVLLVLGFAASSNLTLEQGLHIDLGQWKALILFGLPVAAVASHLLLEWRDSCNRRLVRDLAMHPRLTPDDYFRIGPYQNTTEDAQAYSRADRAHERVLNWIVGARSMLLYLTGDSGVGKSSLLSASVVPALRRRGWTVLETRVWEHPEVTIVGAAENLRASGSGVNGSRSGTLVIIDQFEEILTVRSLEEEKGLLNALDDLTRNPVSDLHVMLVTRSEYVTSLDELGLPRLIQGTNWQPIDPFRVPAAIAFMKSGNLGFNDDILARLVQSASELDGTPSLVRPITLNVLGYVLEGVTEAPSLDAGALVRLYIQQSADRPAIRDFARPVLQELVTEQGTKQSRSEESIVHATGLRRAEVRAVLNSLSSAGLARPVDAARAIWELSHDFIAGAVTRYLSRRPRALLRRAPVYVAPVLVVTSLILGWMWNAREPFLAIPPSSKALIYFTGDGSDDATGRHQAIFVGGASIVDDPDHAPQGKAFYFPGTGSYLQIDAPDLPIGDAPRSIVLWVRPLRYATENNESYFVAYGGFDRWYSSYSLYAIWNGQISVSNWGSGVSGPDRLALNQWQCIASVASKADGQITNTIYRGSASQSAILELNTTPTSHLYVGGVDSNVVEAGERSVMRSMTGYVKHVMVFDTALSSSDVKFICRHPAWKPQLR